MVAGRARGRRRALDMEEDRKGAGDTRALASGR
jgi:hypothetical protein